MSTLRKPTLGPIVGHTTHESCHLWIAASVPGDVEKEATENHRTIGVLGVVKPGTDQVDPEYIYYFRLKRSYDRTGTFALGRHTGLWGEAGEHQAFKPFPMKPNTTYTVRMAVLYVDDALDNDHTISNEGLSNRLPHPESWETVLSNMSDAYTEATFTTYPAPPIQGKGRTSFSFLLGSCRYPGLFWKRKQADRIFGSILRDHILNPVANVNPVKFILMVGDQIYADMLHRFIPIGRADTYQEFQERYHSAFGSRNMSQLLRHLPTYMILDDHEIEDNWTQDRITDRNKRVLFNLAIGAYMSYQWSHGPRKWNNCFALPTDQRLSASDKALHNPQTSLLYYDFLCAGYPFFVLDGRTQRFKDECPGLSDNHLLGCPSQHPTEPNQLDRLLTWLKHQQALRKNTPKFIVSAGVFVPNPVDTIRSDEHKDKSDSWPAFPETRRALLDCIVENGIENVIFLSGDIHSANVARISFSGGPADHLTAYSITSSAFYWPFSFADGDPSNFVHDSRHPDPRNKKRSDTFKLSSGNGTMDYVAWGFTQADNFARIDILKPKNQLQVQMLGQDGSPLPTSKSHRPGASVNTSPHKLKLAAW